MRSVRGLGLAAVLGLCVPVPAAAAESVDEVLARHREAKGGLAAWRAVQALEIRGSYTSFSEVAPFVVLRQRPGSYLFKGEWGGKRVIIGCDGETAWWVNLWYGIDWPHRMPAVDARYTVREALFESPLMDPGAVGATVALEGAGDLDGQPAMVLLVTMPETGEERWFLDAATYLEIGVEAMTHDFGREVMGRTYFSDFREVAGVMLPFHVESEYDIRHRVIEVDSVAINPPIDPWRFALPVTEAMAPLQAMAGSWEVTLESRRTAEEEWSLQDIGTSVIEARANGSLLVERLAYRSSDGTPVEVHRQWSHDRFAERYRMTHLDDFYSQLRVFEGVLEEGTLELDNLATGTARSGDEGERFERYTLSGISEAGFTVERESSSDGGETWSLTRRDTYRRSGD